MLTAQIILFVLAGYALAGFGVALWLVRGGLRRLDDAAARAGIMAKLLWIPAMVALWPWLVARTRQPVSKELHP